MVRPRIKILLSVVMSVLISVLSASIVNADRASSTNFVLERGAITEGFERATSTNFTILNSFGQPAIGISSSTNFILRGGFLHFPVVLEVAEEAAGPTSGPSATISFADILRKILPPFIIPPKKRVCVRGDLNCDGYVNLIDVSIMLYWWDRQIQGDSLASLLSIEIENPDLTEDKYVDLSDMSVLLFHWTG